MNKQKVIILDRDGVINQDSDNFIRTVDQWLPIKGSIEAMAQLYKQGYRLFIFTSQSGIGRGFYTLATMNAMHKKMALLLKQYGAKVEGIVYCPHTPDENCACRKPKPKMLHDIATQYDVDLTQAWVVGDSWRDIQSGLAVGAKVALVATGKGKKTTIKNNDEIKNKNIPVLTNLADFANKLIAKEIH